MPQPTEEQRRQWEEKIKNMSPEELQELQKQQCIFCQIVAGKVPAKKVYEDSVCMVVLDINPAAKGHLLLLPREHYAIMPQVPETVLGHLAIVSKHLSQVLLKVLPADGTTVFIANGAAAGQRAQHFLVHLFPRRSADGVLLAEERLVGKEMALKVKTAIENKLLALLSTKKRVKATEDSDKDNLAKEAPSQEKKSVHMKDENEVFLTSAAAKRYHKEKCPFAQNIPAEKKVILSKEEAEQSARKPCTCVSGKRIPLEKPAKPASAGRKIQTKENKETLLKSAQKPTPNTSVKTKRQKEASLDDIAKLFK